MPNLLVNKGQSFSSQTEAERFFMQSVTIISSAVEIFKAPLNSLC